MNARPLLNREVKLLKCMLCKKNFDFLLKNVRQLKVTDLKDCGMGSVKFIHDSNTKIRKFNKQIEEKEFMDKDNIPISVTINVDQFGDLYEIDIWKVDFSHVTNYPSC